MTAPRILARDVLRTAAAEFGVKVEDLTGPSRTHVLNRRRGLACRAIRRLCPHASYPAIGAMMGARHHTTLIKNDQKLDRALAREPALIAAYDRLVERLTGAAS